MLERVALGMLPSKSFEGGVELLRKLGWVLSYTEKEGKTWAVYAGDQRLLTVGSKEAAQAFLAGMAIAYSAVPLKILRQYKEYADAIGERPDVVREYAKLGMGWEL